MKLFDKIDYLTICYINYDLILAQIENFKSKFKDKNYQLIVIDNTPKSLKNFDKINIIKESPIVSKFVDIDFSSTNDFDGVSHGRAIDIGVKFCSSDVVCVFDSDLFFIKKDIHEYVLNHFNNGLKYIGCEFNDGTKDTLYWVEKFPIEFSFGVFYCWFYHKDIISNAKWETTWTECDTNKCNGFIEMGWRLRKYIIDKNMTGLQWKAQERIRPTTFLDENGNPIVIHIVRGTLMKNNEILSNLKSKVIFDN